jgi:hypothetical protein
VNSVPVLYLSLEMIGFGGIANGSMKALLGIFVVVWVASKGDAVAPLDMKHAARLYETLSEQHLNVRCSPASNASGLPDYLVGGTLLRNGFGQFEAVAHNNVRNFYCTMLMSTTGD